jgi:hypothetical protein
MAIVGGVITIKKPIKKRNKELVPNMKQRR